MRASRPFPPRRSSISLPFAHVLVVGGLADDAPAEKLPVAYTDGVSVHFHDLLFIWLFSTGSGHRTRKAAALVALQAVGLFFFLLLSLLHLPYHGDKRQKDED